jgi:hypothetical protein
VQMSYVAERAMCTCGAAKHLRTFFQRGCYFKLPIACRWGLETLLVLRVLIFIYRYRYTSSPGCLNPTPIGFHRSLHIDVHFAKSQHLAIIRPGSLLDVCKPVNEAEYQIADV